MVSLDDSVLARMEKGGKRYELLVDPEMVDDFKNDPDSVNIDDFLAMDEVFHDASSTQLFFGENAVLTAVFIDGNNNYCSEQDESTSTIRIYDGRIIESECIGSFTYIIFGHIYLSIPCPYSLKVSS